MGIEQLTGLQVMQAIVAGKIPAPSIAETMPMKPLSADYGQVIFEVKADDRHLNPMGGVHGGFAATALDTATGCAVHTVLEAGVSYGTVDLNVKMMRPIPQDKTLIAEGSVINVSKSLGVSEGVIKDEEGKIYAHATCTCMILR